MNFDKIAIMLASPDQIRSWSNGEVIKPETINYRTFKPERDGLFCERIFGPVKDWECSCGKYKGMRYKGVVCDRCGVEVTRARVRRERMGHIELAVPVVHIWYFRSLPSRLRLLLDLTNPELERIIYYESYVVIDPGDEEKTGLHRHQILDINDYEELRLKGLSFDVGIGAPGIEHLLSELDLDDMATDIRTKIKVEKSEQQKKKMLKQLNVIESFRSSPNKVEWMILKAIPVIPPDLRPLIPLEGGRFATSDLNDLYRRLINRNKRLKKLIDIHAPDVILRNEKRMLQEAVDALIDNARLRNPVLGRNQRPLKSLSDLLKGKRGRFRQNLLGKRVDYSGRAVIVVGPKLKLHQCGIPKNMALELFKPFIIRKLEEKGLSQTIKGAKKLVESGRSEIWDLLEEVIKDHPILLNRAPTLHRLGIQAFYPRLVEGNAIQLHPLVCPAFNADFDGDQMAVHVPLSYEAQMEAHFLMLSPHNILSPAHGKPLATPSQDMVLGAYYMTKPREGEKGEGMIFSSPQDVKIAYDQGVVGLHALIKVRVNGEIIETTVGRTLFNEIVPDELGFQNKLMKKGTLRDLVNDAYKKCGKRRTVEFLDRLKELGYRAATDGAISLGIDDMIIPPEKAVLIQKARKEVEKIEQRRAQGLITEAERYNAVIDIWNQTQEMITEALFETLMKAEQGFNPLGMMVDSGSRGSQDQVRQLAGLRGLMAKPRKELTGQEIIETPILSNFREGLSVLEYFISNHGARKGLADTALKTADAGYLTRRLVDVAQGVTVTMDDCGTVKGVQRSALKEGEEVIIPLWERIYGRVANEDVYDPESDDLIVEAGELISEEKAKLIEEKGIESVNIRSVLTCEAHKGVCAKCYGLDLATKQMVQLGEAVGVIAGESIGEPGTQLTLRTFHIGGTASRITEASDVKTKFGGKVKLHRITMVPDPTGEATGVVLGRTGEVIIESSSGLLHKYEVPYGAQLFVANDQKVAPTNTLYRWEPYINPILSDIEGTVEYLDLIENVTFQEQIDETMTKQWIVVESKDRSLHPQIVVRSDDGTVRSYSLPTTGQILVKNGERVKAGQALAKLLRSTAKTKDITGGLPRVAELFEAREPKEPAIISEVDGIVSFIKKSRRTGGIQVQVKGHQGEVREYTIPRGRHILVQEQNEVLAGQQLCDGPIVPHDILRVRGEQAVQEYLLNEVQEVYRLQGVTINDKHIETIVKRMLTKVRIIESGDTIFLENEVVDKSQVLAENQRVIATEEQGEPARFEPLLLGITKASLSTESFISSASFQETTRVLTQAAISGAVDELTGIKENVIIGKLIPAGTGFTKYKHIVPVMEDEKLTQDIEDIDNVQETPYFYRGQFERNPYLGYGFFIDSEKER